MSADHAAIAALRGLPAMPTSVAIDSRRVLPGDLFLAFPGERADGRDFIAAAIAQGASAVIWEAEGFSWNDAWNVPNVGVRELRRLAGSIASLVYGEPSRDLWVAGVTGTNGKTSCTQWIAQSLTAAGRPTAVIGTLGNGFPGELGAATHTTPDPVSLQRDLRRFLDRGAQAVAMEVSSHALDQDRAAGTSIDTALFTNLTRDHLDYHGSMEAYAEAKARLFTWPDLANAVVNIDDRFGRELVSRINPARTRVLSYGLGQGDIAGHDVKLSVDGLSLDIRTPWGSAQLASRVIGGFNVSNLLGTLGVLLTADLSLEEAVAALRDVAPVAGRLDMLRLPGAPLVVVDYAHTPDALEKVLETLRELVGHDTEARLFCVFGCGGDRDAGKRPVMGEIATRLADVAIVTSDNPRSENPMAIIEQIVAGAARDDYLVEVDRAKAIGQALSLARDGDVVLIAGKGHETYQEIGGQRQPFDDLEVARRVLKGGRGV